MYQSVPPLQEMFNMAGMQLPEYLKGKEIKPEQLVDSKKKETDSSEKKE